MAPQSAYLSTDPKAGTPVTGSGPPFGDYLSTDPKAGSPLLPISRGIIGTGGLPASGITDQNSVRVTDRFGADVTPPLMSASGPMAPGTTSITSAPAALAAALASGTIPQSELDVIAASPASQGAPTLRLPAQPVNPRLFDPLAAMTAPSDIPAPADVTTTIPGLQALRDLVTHGLLQAGAAAPTVAQHPLPISRAGVDKESLNGWSEVLEGAAKVGTPAAITGAILNLPATALALSAAYLTSEAAGKGAEYLKASPEMTRFLKNVAGSAAAVYGGKAVLDTLGAAKRSVIDLGAKTRAAGDAAVAAREAARTITPDANVIDVQPVRDIAGLLEADTAPPARRTATPPSPVSPPEAIPTSGRTEAAGIAAQHGGVPVDAAGRPLFEAQGTTEAPPVLPLPAGTQSRLRAQGVPEEAIRAMTVEQANAHLAATEAAPPAAEELRLTPAEQVRRDFIEHPEIVQQAAEMKRKADAAKEAAKATEEAPAEAALMPSAAAPLPAHVMAPPDITAELGDLQDKADEGDLTPTETARQAELTAAQHGGVPAITPHQRSRLDQLIHGDPQMASVSDADLRAYDAERAANESVVEAFGEADQRVHAPQRADAAAYDHEIHRRQDYRYLREKETAGKALTPYEKQLLAGLTDRYAKRVGKRDTLAAVPTYAIVVGGKRYPVASLQDASEKFAQTRDAAEEALGPGVGSSTMPTPIVEENGKPIGYVSYNGRVFAGAPAAWTKDTPILYDPLAKPAKKPVTPQLPPAGGGTGVESGASNVPIQAPPAETAAGDLARGGGAQPGAPAEGGVQPGPSRADRRRARKAARDASRAEAAQYESDDLDSLIAHAKARGFTGDEAGLRQDLQEKLHDFREMDTEYANSGQNGITLLKEIAKAGGLSMEAETGQKGELRWLKEFEDTKPSASRKNLKAPPVRISGQVRGVRGVFVTKARRFEPAADKRVGGLSLDGMLEHLGQDPRFSHIRTIADLHEALRKAASGVDETRNAMGLVGSYLDAELDGLGLPRAPGEGRMTDEEFDAHLQAIRDEAAKNGPKFSRRKEEQPALPGAEAARAVGKADLTFKAPQQATEGTFNLEPEYETPEAKKRAEEEATGQKPLFSRREEPAPPFFSALTRAAENLPQAKGTPDQMAAMLSKGKGVKKEELDFSGVLPWLQSQTGSVTQQQIVDYLRANELQVEEVLHGNSEEDLSKNPHVRELQRLGYDMRVNFQYDPTGEPTLIGPDGEPVDIEADVPDAVHRALYAYIHNEGDVNEEPDTKFSQYTLPGGSNYRELLITLPTSESKEFQDAKTALVEAEQAESAIQLAATKPIFDHYNPKIEPFDRMAIDMGLTRQQRNDARARRDELETTRDREASTAAMNAITQHPRATYVTDQARAKVETLRRAHEASRFTGGHFDEPNVVAHLRFDDREVATDSLKATFPALHARLVAEGRTHAKMLMLQEVQSDLHQKGRKQGYKTDAREPSEAMWTAAKSASNRNGDFGYDRASDFIKDAVLETIKGKDWQETWSAPDDPSDVKPIQDYIDAKVAYLKNTGAMPDAPFKTTWPELAMKRAIRYAAEHGYDTVGFTTGEQQNERYDLSKHVSKIEALHRPDGNFDFMVWPVGKLSYEDITGVTPEKLADTVGKELAEKIQAQPNQSGKESGWRTYKDLDLKIGGSGMKGFYDQILPAFLNKFGKPFGARVGEAQFGGRERTRYTLSLLGDEYRIFDGTEPIGPGFKSNRGASADTQAEAWLQANRDASLITKDEIPITTVHAFEITPQMRDAAMQGLPLFARKETSLSNWFGEGTPKANAKNDGSPMALYHGTRGKFANFKPSSDGAVGPGVYLSKGAELADRFAGERKGANVRMVYARGRYLRIPYDEVINGKAWNIRARNEGYDGVDTGLGELVVFDPKNIRPVSSFQTTALGANAPKGLLDQARAQSDLLKKTYAEMPSVRMGKRDMAVLDAGRRFTPEELKAITSSVAVQRVMSAQLAVLDDVITAMLGKGHKGVERTGMVLDNHTYGVFVPRPALKLGGERAATILLNPFEHMIGKTPEEAARQAYQTAVHETLHWNNPRDNPQFERELAEHLDALGPEFARKARTRIVRAYEGTAGPGRYDPALSPLLSEYSASRRRPERAPDAISRAGSRAPRLATESGSAGQPTGPLRSSRGRAVSEAELRALAERLGVSVAEARRRLPEGVMSHPDVGIGRVPLPEQTKGPATVTFGAGFDPGVDRFVAETGKPFLRAVTGILRGARDMAVNTFEPALPVRRQLGEAPYAEVIRAIHRPEVETLRFDAQRSARFDANFDKLEAFFNQFSKEDLDAFGLSIGTPADINAQRLQQSAREHVAKVGDVRLRDPRLKAAIKDTSDYVYDLAKNAGFSLRYLEDYFYGSYKDEGAVQRFMDHWLTSERWTKEKVFPTRADAAAWGLKLRDVNPITNIKSELASIARRVGLKMLVESYFEPASLPSEDFELTGEARGTEDARVLTPEARSYVAQVANATRAQQQQWRKIEEPLFNGLLFHPAYARLVNNLIATNKVSANPALRTIRAFGFKGQQLKFFGSIFHLQNELKASVSAEMGGVFNPRGWADFARSFKALDKTDPQYQEYVALGGGHRYSLESQAQTQIQAAIEKIGRGNVIAGVARIPLGVLQQKWIPASPGMIRWMFDELIPALKFRKWQHAVATLEAKVGRGLSDAEKIRLIRENQNFYGEMNERLFGRSGTVTSALRLVFLAPGYGEGNFRAAFSAGLEGAAAGRRIVGAGAGAGAPPRPPTAGPEPAGSRTGWTEAQRQWVATSFLLHTLLYSAVLATIGTRLMTGKWPDAPKQAKDIRDLFKVKTGQKDANGNDVYIDLMTYDKDYWTLYGNLATGQPDRIAPELVTRVGNATSVTFRFLTDMAMLFQGRMIFDWKREPVWVPSDDAAVKLKKFLKYEGDQLSPISFSTFMSGRQSGFDKAKAVAMAVAGLRRTTSEREKPSPALQYLYNVMPAQPPASEGSEARHDLRIATKNRDAEAMREAASRLGPRSVRATILSARRYDALQAAFKPTTLDQAIHAYELMTPEERREIRPLLIGKMRSLFPNVPPAEKRSTQAAYAAAVRLPMAAPPARAAGGVR